MAPSNVSATSTNGAADYLPRSRSLPRLRAAAKDCRGCPLYLRATQTVFGRGPAPARLMLVGEVPGDQEDRMGEPFVGPAGRLLDEALAAAGVDRDSVYLTNAVKHFKWEPQGKRRLHKKPSAREVSACHPWLEAEIEAVDPRVIVCLGATAAQSLLGHAFRITRRRGELLPFSSGASLLATWHPSAILRSPRASDRHRLREELFDDLRLAVENAARS